VTYLRIVDPDTGEVGLSYQFDPQPQGAAIVVNCFHGSSVVHVDANDDEVFLYFVKVDNFQTGTAPTSIEPLVAPNL